MYEHPDRAPASGLEAAARIAATVVAMTLASVVMCAVVAAMLIATTNPLAVAAAAIVAILVGGFTAGTLSRWLHP